MFEALLLAQHEPRGRLEIALLVKLTKDMMWLKHANIVSEFRFADGG
jgi:hypothetical protein